MNGRRDAKRNPSEDWLGGVEMTARPARWPEGDPGGVRGVTGPGRRGFRSSESVSERNNASVNPLLGTSLSASVGKDSSQGYPQGELEGSSARVTGAPRTLVRGEGRGFTDRAPTHAALSHPSSFSAPRQRRDTMSSTMSLKESSTRTCRVARLCQSVATVVWVQWRAHFLVLLFLCIAICLVFIGIDSTALVHTRETRKVANIAMTTASVALRVSADCSTSRTRSRYAPAPVSPRLRDLRSVIARAEKRRRSPRSSPGLTWVRRVDTAIAALAAPSCERALESLSALFTDLYKEVELLASSRELAGVNSDTSVSGFANAWTVATAQLRSEGLLQYREQTPVPSLRALRGVSGNLLCQSPPIAEFSTVITPELTRVLYCDAEAQEEVLAITPVLQPPQFYVRSIIPLFKYLMITWSSRIQALPNNISDGHYIIHMVLHSAIVVLGVLSIALLVRASVRRKHEEQTEAVVRRDFRLIRRHETKSTSIAMGQSSLRVLDAYCWSLGNLEPAMARAAERAALEHEPRADPRARARVVEVSDFDLVDAAATAGKWVGVGRARWRDSRSTRGDSLASSESVANASGVEVVVVEGQRFPSLTRSGTDTEADSRRWSYRTRDSFAWSDEDRSRRARSRDGSRAVGSVVGFTLADRLLQYHMRQQSMQLVNLRPGDTMDFNHMLLSQPNVRAALLREYAREYAQLRDATQIHLLLHQLVHPMLLVRPFVPPFMARPLGLSAEDASNLGPGMERGAHGAGVVMREGLEDDCRGVVYGRGEAAAVPPPSQQRSPTGSSSPSRSPGACAAESSTTAYLFLSLRSFNAPDTIQRAVAHYQSLQQQQQQQPHGARGGWRPGGGGGVAGSTDGLGAGEATDVVTVAEGSSGAGLQASVGRSLSAGSGSGGGAGSSGSSRSGGGRHGVLGGRLTAGVRLSPTDSGAGSLNPLLASTGSIRGGSSGGGGGGAPAVRDGHGVGRSASRSRLEPPPLPVAYPLSVIAAGVNLMLHCVHAASTLYHGEVVQVSSDGVLVQFRNEHVVRHQQVHCFGPSRDLELVDSGVSPSLGPHGGSQDGQDRSGTSSSHHQRVAAMCVEERAARAALSIEANVRAYLSTGDGGLIPGELLRCPQVVLSDDSCPKWLEASLEAAAAAAAAVAGAAPAPSTSPPPTAPPVGPTAAEDSSELYPRPATAGALRGVVSFHVSKHYSVISRCVPLFFALENVALEHGSPHILMTRAVRERIAGVSLSSPVHYLDVPNLHVYHYQQGLAQDQADAAVPTRGSGLPPVDRAAASELSTPNGGSSRTAALFPGATSLRLDSAAAAERQRLRRASAVKVCRLPFDATGTVYELQAMAPVEEDSAAYAAYTAQRERTQARREHWSHIWTLYEDVLRSRRELRPLYAHLDRMQAGAVRRGYSNMLGASADGSLASPLRSSTAARTGAGGGPGGRVKGTTSEVGPVTDVVMLVLSEKECKRGPAASRPPPSVAGSIRLTAGGSVGGLGSGTPRRDPGAAESSNAGSSSVNESPSHPGSAAGGSVSNPWASGGSGMASGSGRRSHDTSPVSTVISRLQECLRELASYRHIYGTLPKQEGYAFHHVVDDVVGMLLALGISKSDIEW